jgi:hypothetical protein
MSKLVATACGLFAVLSFSSCAQAAPLAKLDWPVRSNDAAPAGKEIAAQAPQARAMLDQYEKTEPVRGDRVLRIVYWTPADREPSPQYRERLSAIMLDIQAWYARELERNGFGTRTFKLHKEADGMLEIFMARGDKTRDHYSGANGQEIRNDCIKTLAAAGIDGNKETILIFCNLTDWDAEKRHAGGSSPYYASGTTRKGTAWQSDSPILDLPNILNVNDADKVTGQYGKTTLGHYNSIFIGGIAHELGHALSMPHDIERPDQAAWGKALMGSGNRTYGEEFRTIEVDESKGRGTFLPFADALRLASHPSFSGSVKGFDIEPNAQLHDVQITTDGKSITYAARVTSTPATYGIVAYFDPAGGGDYDATTATAIPDKNGNFKFTSDALAKGKSGELRVVTLQVNGAASSGAAGAGTTPSYPYNVAADGKVDLSLWNTQQQLAPVAAAVKANDRNALESALRALEDDNASEEILEIARVQLDLFNDKPLPSPAEYTGNALYLSEAKPAEAKVGWLKPTYNRLPNDGGNSPLLAAGGKYYARGIYAHAPAKHVYELGGKWKSLSGFVGAPEGKDPSVVFVIVADGTELGRTPTIHAGEVRPFAADVTGVQKLELRVEDGGNGNGSDWGVWLDPQLTR